MLRGWVAPALLVLVSLLLGLVLIETVGPHIVGAGRLAYYEDIDHLPKPHSAPDINGDGIRSDLEAGHFRFEDQNIVFLGDSFVFGWRLPAEQSLPAQFAQIARDRHPLLGLRVANFGWASSSPYLSYRQLRRIGRRYSPDVVILAVDMTDFHDDLKYRALLEGARLNALMDWTPVTVLTVRKLMTFAPPLYGLHEVMFGFPASRFFVTRQPLEKSRPWLGAIRESIESVARFTHDELGADFVLLLLPRGPH
jgi:hypothetical protein